MTPSPLGTSTWGRRPPPGELAQCAIPHTKCPDCIDWTSLKEWHDRLHEGMRVPSGNGINAPVDVIRARWATGTPPEALQGTVADVRCLLRHLELAEEAGEALKDELAEQRRVQANLKESASQANERSREWAQKAVQDDEQKDALRGQCADLEDELKQTRVLKEDAERVARIASHERNQAIDAAQEVLAIVTQKQMKKIKKKGLADDDPRDPNI